MHIAWQLVCTLPRKLKKGRVIKGSRRRGTFALLSNSDTNSYPLDDVLTMKLRQTDVELIDATFTLRYTTISLLALRKVSK